LFNLEDSNHQFDLPKNGKFKDLMTGAIIDRTDIFVNLWRESFFGE